MANEIKYIQFEPGAFIGDIEFQVMTARQRGVYISLILYLYSNDGVLPNTVQTLFKLCSSTPETFKEDWQEIKHKFIVTPEAISHKRVAFEIERSKEYRNNKSMAGKKSGESRRKKALLENEQRSNDVETDPQLRNVTKRNVKGSKVNNDTSGSPLSQEDRISIGSDGIKLYDSTCELFGVASKPDRTTLKNIAVYMTEMQKTNSGIFKEIWRMAQDCKKTGDKPIALFIARLKDEYGYRKLRK